MKTVVKRIMSGIMALFVLVAILPSEKSFAVPKANQVVRVGWYESDNFQEGTVGEDIKSGYAYEYLQEIANYVNWDYEYVYGGWNDLYRMLIKGDIDIMAGFVYTEERADVVLYPDSPMGYEEYYIFKRTTDTSIDSADITTLSGKRIGTLKNSSLSTFLQDWKRKNRISCEEVQFGSFEERDAAFIRGEIDAVVDVNTSISTERGLAPTVFVGEAESYIAVAHEREDILDALNDAQARISENEPYYKERLKLKYYKDLATNASINATELDWINENGKIVIGCLKDYLPISQQDENGNTTGVIVDVFEDWRERLGITNLLATEYRAYANYDDMLNGLSNGEVDLAFPVTDSLWISEQANIMQSDAVLDMAFYAIHRDNYDNHTTDTIAVSKHNGLLENYVKMHFPDSTIYYTENTQDSLNAIREGKVGCTLLVSNIAERFFASADNSAGTLKLKNIGITASFSIGVSAGNSELFSLLVRGVSLMDRNENNSVIHRYVFSDYQYTAMDFIRENVLLVFAIFGVVILSIGVALMLFMRGSKREKENNKRLKQQLSIIDSLSRDYLNVYLINIESRKFQILKLDGYVPEQLRGKNAAKEEYAYEPITRGYIENRVYEEDKEMMRRVLDLDNVLAQIGDNYEYAGTYRIQDNGEVSYYQYKYIVAEDGSHLIAGFQNIDSLVRETEAQHFKLEESLRLTEEKKAELQEQDSIIASAGFGVWHIILEDGKAPRMKANAKMLEIMGWQDALFTEEELYDFWYSRITEGALESVNASAAEMLNNHFSENTYLWIHPVRGPVYVRCGGVAQESTETRKVLGGYHSDVTSIVQGEQEQRQALRTALNEAERANRAKTTFLNNMSHDIRTPMNAIIGFTTLAKSHPDNPELILDYLSKIQTSSNHLLALINDVLDMSRIESGVVTIKEREVSLPEVMIDLKNIVKTDVEAKSLKLDMAAIDVTDERVICDRLRLYQVLLNFISNAMKFTNARGSVSVKLIQIHDTTEGHAHYEFHIKDTGIGMSKEFQEHIFEPFTREQTSTVSGIQGTGLGMSIAKNIVDMMGGKINLISEEGKGTEFIVSFWVKTVEDENADADDNLSNLRALVIDKDTETCVSTCKMLKCLNMRAEWTTNCNEAVRRAAFAKDSKDPFSAYIINWQLPDEDGIKIAKEIKEVTGTDNPAIILTSYDSAEIEEEAKEAGVTGFCTKPVFRSRLQKALSKGREPLETKAAKEEKIIVSEHSFKGKRILLAEDNWINQEIVCEILKEIGIEVEVAGDGCVAVEKLETEAAGYYDLILMDIQMPKMDGYEATKCIREMADTVKANIPIVALTANAFSDDKQHAIDAGMNAHISKPIDVNKFIATLSKIL